MKRLLGSLIAVMLVAIFLPNSAYATDCTKKLMGTGTSGTAARIQCQGYLDTLNVAGAATITGATTQTGALGVTGALTATGGITTGGNIVSDTDSTDDLGTSSVEFNDMFIDGTAHIDTLDVDVAAGVTGDLTITSGTVIQEEKILIPAALGFDGATNVEWTVNAANLSEVTLAASNTADVWIVPVTGLNVGDTITAFNVSSQIESGGNTATLDADLRKHTNTAADPADASVGEITQVSVSADTASEAEKTGLAEVVASGEWFYVKITGTTAASTDIRLLGIEVTVTKGNE